VQPVALYLETLLQDFVLAGCRLKPIKALAYTIRPVECAGLRIPNWALSAKILVVGDDVQFGGRSLHSLWIQQVEVSPPSTTSVWPVTYEESSDARKTATRATSSGWPTRPSGTL
jgi:hypothetical protein